MALRTILFDQNSLVGSDLDMRSPILAYEDIIYSESQAMPSSDMFHALEPIKFSIGFVHEETFSDVNSGVWYSPEYYSAYDFSFILGPGLCSPVWFSSKNNYLISGYDCNSMQHAFQDNIAHVTKVMKSSLQTEVELMSVEEIVHDFGLG